MFDFEFVYILGAKYRGLDRLLRRRATENEREKEDKGIKKAKNWVDEGGKVSREKRSISFGDRRKDSR